MEGYRLSVYENYVTHFKGACDGSSEGHLPLRKAAEYDALLGKLISKIKPTTLLDVGCGQGQLLAWAKRKGVPFPKGCDLSHEQVAVAMRAGLSVSHGAYENFLAAEESNAEIVCALDLIEHFTKDECFRFARACHAALKPGGVLVLTTPNGEGIRPGNVIFGDLTHETIFTPKSITTLLSICGFGNIKVREMAPSLNSLKSVGRRLIWSVLRLHSLLLDLVETGSWQSSVRTRVMVVTAER